MDFKAKRKLNKKNQQSTQENSFLMESLKVIGNILDEEQQKHIALEQHGRKEMIGVSRIKAFERDNYKQIIYKVCPLAKTNIKMDNIEIVHIIKNGSIIIKLSERGKYLLKS